MSNPLCSSYDQADYRRYSPYSWAVVQFKAAMAYLRTDPLQLLSTAQASPPSDEVTPHSASAVGGTDEVAGKGGDNVALPSAHSRKASMQSSSTAEPARLQDDSPMSWTVLPKHHRHHSAITSSSTTRLVTYLSTGEGKRSSVVSTVTTEDEDHAEMGPPPKPKRDTRKSTDEERSRPDVTLSSLCQQRSALSHSTVIADLQSQSSRFYRPQAVRAYPRSFHFSHDLSGISSVNQPTRIPLGRSQTTPYSPNDRQVRQSSSSAELQRTGSDRTRRNSIDWYGPLKSRYASPPPAGSNASTSSRPDSPGSPATRLMDRSYSERSSFDLEKSTGDIGWLEWGRKRLSSMTSSS